MGDIVDRLREPNGMADSALSPGERRDAADEIDRLRALVEFYEKGGKTLEDVKAEIGQSD